LLFQNYVAYYAKAKVLKTLQLHPLRAMLRRGAA